MPAANTALTATYKNRLYILTVVNGTGDGTYAAGTSVIIDADPPTRGQSV